MKVNGIDETNHKIFGEIERNRNFIKSIKEAEDEGNKPAQETQPGQPEKRLKVDTAAATRMVKNHLGANSKIEAEQTAPEQVGIADP